MCKDNSIIQEKQICGSNSEEMFIAALVYSCQQNAPMHKI